MDSDREPKRFAIAVSFPGEDRHYVRGVVDRLAVLLGRERIFYDEWYEAELVGKNGDLKLKRYYKDQSDMIVPFFSHHYKKPWCGIEWETIRAIHIDRPAEDNVIPVALDNTQIEGWEAVDIAIRRNNRTAEGIADLLFEVYQKRFSSIQIPESRQMSRLLCDSLPIPTGSVSIDEVFDRIKASRVDGIRQLLVRL